MARCKAQYTEKPFGLFVLGCDLEEGHLDLYHFDRIRELRWLEDNASLVPAVSSD